MQIPFKKTEAARLGAAVLAISAALFTTQQAQAHGYISEPASRDYMCRLGSNTGCGAVQYEPQSVGETHKGFPAAGPEDGKIPSAGNTSFSAVDVQTASRWTRHELTDRTLKVQWHYTAAHRTTKWEYFVSKQGWNPNAPLTRETFELTPFCVVDGKGEVPIDGPMGGHGPGKVKHECQIPADRTGHHVVLGIWTVDDTAMAFHKIIDVDIKADAGPGEPVDGWSAVGNISAAQALKAGDKVKLRAFTGSAESQEHSVEMPITAGLEEPLDWAHALALKVNESSDVIRAGIRGEDNAIEPVPGRLSQLFAKPESGVTNFQMHYELVGDPEAFMHFHASEPAYELVKGRTDVGFSVMTNRTLAVEASIFNADNQQVGQVRQTIAAGTVPLNVSIRSVPGAHTITLVGTSEDGRTVLQAVKQVEMTGEAGGSDYEYVYPAGITSYVAGTKVLNAQLDKVFECKPWPYTAWCQGDAAAYAPGTGRAWDQAWIALD
jgi:chitin-binding protein